VLTCSPVYLPTFSPGHLLTCSPAHRLTCSPAHLLTCPPAHLLTWQPAPSRDDLPLPPQRSRKVAGRSRGGAQLRLSIHQELKSLRSSTSILPESLVARYRPQPRQGSTAVVLWTPPLSVSLLPDLVSSALRNTEQRPSGCGRHRTRCYSEVTSTPYSSHENLLACSDSDMPDLATCEGPSMGPPLPCSASSASTAEAPELSYGEPACVPPGCSLQRRNSAPEISEPSPYVDDGSMEL